VFYYLLAGASEQEKKVFHLTEPQDFSYLNQVSVEMICLLPSIMLIMEQCWKSRLFSICILKIYVLSDWKMESKIGKS
jgi:hypothetical protein